MIKLYFKRCNTHIILLLFLLLTLQQYYPQSGWQFSNPLPQNNDLRDVYFSDEQNGWAVGLLGRIIRTTDGGISWSIQKSETRKDLLTVHFIDNNNGWIGGIEGTILKTANGGNTWTKINPITTLGISSIYFIDSNNGWYLDGSNDIYKTTDAGNTWIGVSLSVEGWRDVFFINQNRGWAVGWRGKIACTMNGGNNWYVDLSFNNEYPLFSVHFSDEQNGWAVGSQGTILRTTNSGQSWTRQLSGVIDVLEKVFCLSDSLGIAVGGESTLLRTTDGGNNWINYTDITKLPLFGINFIDSFQGWIVGIEGIMFKTSDSGQTWTNLLKGPINDMGSICITANNTIWIGGSEGLIMKSIDYGDSWELMAPISEQGNLINFVDENLGWAIGDSSIWRTTNAGGNWELQYNNPGWCLYDSYFDESGFGIIVGERGLILKTTNSGNSWIDKSVDIRYFIYSISFIDNNIGWAAGLDSYQGRTGFLSRTTDAGESWSYQYFTGIMPYFGSVYFINQDIGWAVGGNVMAPYSGILKTTDGGLTWDIKIFENHLLFHDVFFIDENNGWVCGDGGVIYNTTNGGDDWILQSDSTIYRGLGKIKMINNDIGFAAGMYGTILKTTNGGMTHIEDEEISLRIGNNFLLKQNYPNPFNSTTNISYSILDRSNVSLKVYNLLGEEVAALAQGEKESGSYEINFDSANLTSGVYFYQLKAGNYIQTKKMILLK